MDFLSQSFPFVLSKLAKEKKKSGWWNRGPDDSRQICATESPARAQEAIIGWEVKKRRKWPCLIGDFITFPSVREGGESGQVFQAVKKVQFDLQPSPTLAVHQNLILTGDKVQALSHTPGRVWINAAGQPHSDCKMVENGKTRRCSGLITDVTSLREPRQW